MCGSMLYFFHRHVSIDRSNTCEFMLYNNIIFAKVIRRISQLIKKMNKACKISNKRLAVVQMMINEYYSEKRSLN